jgi:hypothetical protein
MFEQPAVVEGDCAAAATTGFTFAFLRDSFSMGFVKRTASVFAVTSRASATRVT